MFRCGSVLDIAGFINAGIVAMNYSSGSSDYLFQMDSSDRRLQSNSNSSFPKTRARRRVIASLGRTLTGFAPHEFLAPLGETFNRFLDFTQRREEKAKGAKIIIELLRLIKAPEPGSQNRRRQAFQFARDRRLASPTSFGESFCLLPSARMMKAPAESSVIRERSQSVPARTSLATSCRAIALAAASDL